MIKLIMSTTILWIATASLFFPQSLRAQAPTEVGPLNLTFGAAQAQAVCNVNGVDYPVDGFSRIWGQDPTSGRWVIIGRIVATPYGYRADGIDGRSYPAFCH
jgi:hypothetical protein